MRPRQIGVDWLVSEVQEHFPTQQQVATCLTISLTQNARQRFSHNHTTSHDVNIENLKGHKCQAGNGPQSSKPPPVVEDIQPGRRQPSKACWKS